MEVPWRSVEHDNVRALGNLGQRKLRVNGGLCIRIGVNGGRALNAGDSRVGREGHDARRDCLLGIRSLRFAVVRLDYDRVILVGDGVFDQGVLFIVGSLSVKHVNGDVVVFRGFFHDRVGKPGSERVGLCAGDVSHAEHFAFGGGCLFLYGSGCCGYFLSGFFLLRCCARAERADQHHECKDN